MESTSGLTTILGVVYAFSRLVELAGLGTLLYVVMRIVRLHRPDAWKPLGLAVGITLTATVLGTISTTVLPYIATRGSDGLSGYYKLMIGQSLVFTAVSIIYWALFIPGLAKLARPRQEQSPEGVPPYR